MIAIIWVALFFVVLLNLDENLNKHDVAYLVLLRFMVGLGLNAFGIMLYAGLVFTQVFVVNMIIRG